MDMVLVKTPNGALAPADEEARALIEKLKAGQGVRATIRRALALYQVCGYTFPVTSKKGMIGIGVSFPQAAKSRNTAMDCGFHLCGPVYGGPNVGPQGRRLKASACGPVRQPVRAAALIGVEVAACTATTLEAIMAKTTCAPAQSSTTPTASPLAAAHAVFGERPKDVLFPIEVATCTLGWLESIFHAIETLNERNGGSIDIKRLAEVGAYVSEGFGAQLEGDHAQMLKNIEAAEAQEGGAA